jgi:hypothetical protein
MRTRDFAEILDRDDAAVCFERDQFFFSAGGKQTIQEIAAMHDDIGLAIARAERVAEIDRGNPRPAYGVHPDEPARIDGVLADLGQQAERVEHPHGVGRELQPGTDLAEFRRLLDDMDAAIPAAQGQGGGEPGDAAADDQNRDLLHRCLLPRRREARRAGQ